MKFTCLVGLACIATAYGECTYNSATMASGEIKMNVNCGAGTLYSCTARYGDVSSSAQCRGFFNGVNKQCSGGWSTSMNRNSAGECCAANADCQSNNCNNNICI